MSYRTTDVLLSLIELDPFFEQDEQERITSSINRDGLLNPLIVEESKGKEFILVDGYKRYSSLKRLGWQEVCCIVEEETDPVRRMVKKLKRDFNTRKMVNSERVRIVHKLLSSGWSGDKISKETGISKSVIKTYASLRNISQDTKDVANSLELGQEGLLSLNKIRNSTSSRTYIIILDILRGIDKKYAYFLKSIEHVSKNPGFNNLPVVSIKRVVYKAINESKFTATTANREVALEKVANDATRDPIELEIALKYALERSEELSRIITPRIIKYASPDRRRKLILNLEQGLKSAKADTYRRGPFSTR